MEEVVKPFHHRDARGLRGFGNLLCLGTVACERFLGEHRFARLDRREVPRCVQRIRQRVVDGIDFRVGDHLGVGAQNTFDTVLFGEELGTASIACGDGNQPVTQLLGWSDDGEIGDSGCTEHPDPQAHTVTLRHTFCMYVTLAATSRSGPSSVGSSSRMVSCSITNQPSNPLLRSAVTMPAMSTSPAP